MNKIFIAIVLVLIVALAIWYFVLRKKTKIVDAGIDTTFVAPPFINIGKGADPNLIPIVRISKGYDLLSAQKPGNPNKIEVRTIPKASHVFSAGQIVQLKHPHYNGEYTIYIATLADDGGQWLVLNTPQNTTFTNANGDDLEPGGTIKDTGKRVTIETIVVNGIQDLPNEIPIQTFRGSRAHMMSTAFMQNYTQTMPGYKLTREYRNNSYEVFWKKA